jgi:hypothetical protein
MKFIYPEFLFALLLIAIPILIHLFNFKKFKQVYFSNLRFLKEINLQTQSRSKLKHLLVLLMRVLSLSFLVFAFAQPYIPGNKQDESKGEKIISIYIDNSFSMQAQGQQGELLNVAKQKAHEIARQYSPTDRFQLVSNDFFAWQQRLYTREEFLELVNQLDYASVSRSFSEVLLRQNDLLNQFKAANKRYVWISDFQSAAADFENIKDFSGRLVCIPVQAEKQANISIDSIWFSTPVRQYNAKEKLFVRIRNYSDMNLENIPLKLEINGAVKSIRSINIPAHGYCDSSLNYVNIEKGILHANVSISDLHVIYDDKYYFSYQVAGNLNILSINPDNSKDTNTYLSKLFKNDEYFNFKQTRLSDLDYASLGKYQLIILNQLTEINSGLATEINKALKNGTNVLIFPSINSHIESYNNLFKLNQAALFLQPDTQKTKLKSIDYSNPFFTGIFEKENNNIDMPVINYHYTQENYSNIKQEKILLLQNNNSFLSRYLISKGYLYVCASPLNDKAGNFARHALFVPVILRIAEWSNNSIPENYTLNSNNSIEFSDAGYSLDGAFEISSLNGESFIPQVIKTPPTINLFTQNQIKQSGNYNILYEGKAVYGVAFNYNRKESDPNCLSLTEIEKKINHAGIQNFTVANPEESNNNINIELIDNSFYYWKICIILVILFLLTETILLRFWKV